MTTKKILACLMASMMICGAFAGCDKKEEEKSSSSVSESSASESSEASDSASESSAADEESKVVATVATPEFEDAIAAESGDAYLAMVDGQWWIQYWGAVDDGSVLCYDAGVTPITGDGEYTVSLTTDTNGFRFDTTGDANNTDVMASGCSFAAVMVKDGTTLFPNMAIEITSIKVDGNEIPMTAKNYTSSDDGKEMRANIYNSFISEAPEDAHDANGSVYGNPDYSPQIIDPAAAFGNGWTDIEVTFNVTGTGAEGGAEAEGAESEAAEGEESSAEESAAE